MDQPLTVRCQEIGQRRYNRTFGFVRKFNKNCLA